MSCGFCTGEIKLSYGAVEGITAWMPEAFMPQFSRGGVGQQRLRRGRPEGIQLAINVTSEHLRPCRKILDRKTKGIKLNGHIVITGERTHINQIFDKSR